MGRTETTRHKLALCICILHWHQYLHSLKSTHSLNVGNPKRNGSSSSNHQISGQLVVGRACCSFQGGEHIINCLNDFAANQGRNSCTNLECFKKLIQTTTLSSSNCSIIHPFSVGCPSTIRLLLSHSHLHSCLQPSHISNFFKMEDHQI